MLWDKLFSEDDRLECSSVPPNVGIVEMCCDIEPSLAQRQLGIVEVHQVGLIGIEILATQKPVVGELGIVTMKRRRSLMSEFSLSREGMTDASPAECLDWRGSSFAGCSRHSRGCRRRRKVKGDRRSFALHMSQEGEKLLQKLETAHSRITWYWLFP